MTYTTPLTAAGLTAPREFASRVIDPDALRGRSQSWWCADELRLNPHPGKTRISLSALAWLEGQGAATVAEARLRFGEML